jgi:hypothetical protein
MLGFFPTRLLFQNFGSKSLFSILLEHQFGAKARRNWWGLEAVTELPFIANYEIPFAMSLLFLIILV